MELTFNAITANRSLGKAMRKHGLAVDAIESAFAQADIPASAFKVLQIIVFDHPRGEVSRPMRKPKDGIFQLGIGVGTPDFLRLSQEEFASELIFACRTALQAAKFDDELKSALLACVDRAEG